MMSSSQKYQLNNAEDQNQDIRRNQEQESTVKRNSKMAQNSVLQVILIILGILVLVCLATFFITHKKRKKTCKEDDDCGIPKDGTFETTSNPEDSPICQNQEERPINFLPTIKVKEVEQSVCGENPQCIRLTYKDAIYKPLVLKDSPGTSWQKVPSSLDAFIDITCELVMDVYYCMEYQSEEESIFYKCFRQVSEITVLGWPEEEPDMHLEQNFKPEFSNEVESSEVYEDLENAVENAEQIEGTLLVMGNGFQY